MKMGLGRHADEPVVSDLLSLLALRGFNDSYQSRLDHASGEGGFVHEEENVERIAIFAGSPRDEAEVEGEPCADGKDGAESECLELLIETELVSRPLRSLDDDLEVSTAYLGTKGRDGGSRFHAAPLSA